MNATEEYKIDPKNRYEVIKSLIRDEMEDCMSEHKILESNDVLQVILDTVYQELAK